MAEKEKRERQLTPVGFAKWAHLDKPKPSFQGKGEPTGGRKWIAKLV